MPSASTLRVPNGTRQFFFVFIHYKLRTCHAFDSEPVGGGSVVLILPLPPQVRCHNSALHLPCTSGLRFLFYSACPCIPMPRECASVCRCWLSWRRRALHVTMYFQPDFILSSRLTERRVSSFLSFFFQGMSTEEEGST
jgi:hypothetical protein